MTRQEIEAIAILIAQAKHRTFRAQDLAAKIDDQELRQRLELARGWLEAADRRVTDLAGKAGE